MAIDQRLFDIRTVERNINSGRITREDYENYLQSLDDVASNSTPIEVEYIEDILSHDDETA